MKPVTVFFDLDGVLANFVSGALFVHGRRDVPMHSVRWDIESQLGIEPRLFWEPLGYGFWSSLPVLEDGFELLARAESLVGRDRIAILSSPCQTHGCLEGKRDWVRKHLPNYERRLFLGSAKHLFAGPNKVLVDDHDKNCDQFADAGGAYVKVPRPWNGYRSQCLEDGFTFSVDQFAGEIEAAVCTAGS